MNDDEDTFNFGKMLLERENARLHKEVERLRKANIRYKHRLDEFEYVPPAEEHIVLAKRCPVENFNTHLYVLMFALFFALPMVAFLLDKFNK